MTLELQHVLAGIAIGVAITLIAQWAAAANVRRTDRVRRDREWALMERRAAKGWGSVEDLPRRGPSTILGEVATMHEHATTGGT